MLRVFYYFLENTSQIFFIVLFIASKITKFAAKAFTKSYYLCNLSLFEIKFYAHAIVLLAAHRRYIHAR